MPHGPSICIRFDAFGGYHAAWSPGLHQTKKEGPPAPTITSTSSRGGLAEVAEVELALGRQAEVADDALDGPGSSMMRYIFAPQRTRCTATNRNTHLLCMEPQPRYPRSDAVALPSCPG